MPKRKKIEPFFLVIKDEDKHLFNVIGPIDSDYYWNEEIIKAQKKGRDVRCFSHPGSDSKDTIINMLTQSRKYSYSTVFIVEEPEDLSVVYSGSLPKYARNADRKRVVRVLCKGRCSRIRWAEMEVDYPGEETLRNSQVMDFRARCLLCGHIAQDPYNWDR